MLPMQNQFGCVMHAKQIDKKIAHLMHKFLRFNPIQTNIAQKNTLS